MTQCCDSPASADKPTTPANQLLVWVLGIVSALCVPAVIWLYHTTQANQLDGVELRTLLKNQNKIMEDVSKSIDDMVQFQMRAMQETAVMKEQIKQLDNRLQQQERK
ncbi:hypothetical protein [Pseudoalteromonas rubra]|uniref:hypothetical protein n=1 Tax=Pseudoalteromonas rubra TaxID=43658 RepID=UPI002DBB754E|nr:hypothetical protein [Pseudoalteromonas rubra]MEC4091594.1 hypothetical protein [Pseudoalteromonas rubra]